jgi:hypothetical protein
VVDERASQPPSRLAGVRMTGSGVYLRRLLELSAATTFSTPCSRSCRSGSPTALGTWAASPSRW